MPLSEVLAPKCPASIRTQPLKIGVSNLCCLEHKELSTSVTEIAFSKDSILDIIIIVVHSSKKIV